MDDAVAFPGEDLLLREPGNIEGEVPVRDKDHLVLIEGLHHLHRVCRGAADIALRLHLRGGIHIGNHGGIGRAVPEQPNLARRDHLCHGAAGIGSREDDLLFRREDGRGLGHEVHAAEDDDLAVHGGSGPGELQGVPHEVGDLLDRPNLVVVGQDDGIPLLLESPDLFPQCSILHRSPPVLHHRPSGLIRGGSTGDDTRPLGVGHHVIRLPWSFTGEEIAIRTEAQSLDERTPDPHDRSLAGTLL